MIDTLVRYGLNHPIVRVPGSPWVVVGMIGPSWWHLEQEMRKPTIWSRIRAVLERINIVRPVSPFYTPDRPLALEIHLDADNPHHEFLDAGSWPSFPNSRKLADWYNAPYRKSQRLRDRRSTEWSAEDSTRVTNEFAARDALELQRLIAADADEAHIVGVLEYYPDGHKVHGPQVWRDGRFWTRLNPSNERVTHG